ncbi:LamG domain-containing protein, partial [Actinocrinis puniceicyclus]
MNSPPKSPRPATNRKRACAPKNRQSHTWPLDDAQTGTAATAADTTGAVNATALPLTGTSGATWHTGDVFSPDVQLDGKTGYLTTSSKALDLTGSFTLDAWVNPTALGGAVLAQNGSADAGLTLYAGSNGWVFALNTGAGTANSYDTITGGTVQLSAWTHLTVSYDTGNHVMSLYVDDVYVANGNHTAPTTGATGDFVIGYDGTRSFTGQIAQVQAWNGTALSPVQPYTP